MIRGNGEAPNLQQKWRKGRLWVKKRIPCENEEEATGKKWTVGITASRTEKDEDFKTMKKEEEEEEERKNIQSLFSSSLSLSLIVFLPFLLVLLACIHTHKNILSSFLCEFVRTDPPTHRLLSPYPFGFCFVLSISIYISPHT